MKRIVLVEDSADCRVVGQALAGESDGLLVIHCNAGVDLGPLPGSWQLKSESDYYDRVDLQSLNTLPHRDLQGWLNLPEISVLFSEPPASLTSLFAYELGRAMGTAYKFADLLRAIIENETPDELVAVEWPASPASRLRFGAQDKFIGRLVPAVLESLNKEFSSLHLRILKPVLSAEELSNLRPRAGHLKRYPDFVLRAGLKKIQQALNALCRYRAGKRPRVMFKGAPRLVFGLMDRLKQDGQFNPVYYQPEIAPRLFFTLMRRGVEYKNLGVAAEPQTADWAARKKEFYAVAERQRLFSYRGVNLVPMLREKFDYLFDSLLAQMAAELRLAACFLEKEKPAAFIVDEENSVSSQCLLLAARNLSVATMEYQHGAIYHYQLQSRLAQRYLLWGDFFKDKLNRELQIPVEKIRVVGPVHLAPFCRKSEPARLDRQKSVLCKKLGISPDAGFILYATHSFNKGSRGGLHNVHMSRCEITDLLTCILKSISQTPEKHLVIKLHHEDHNVSFYREFMNSSGRGTRYSVVQSLSIYDLIRACDFLITPPSTTVLEAILMDKPVLLADFGAKRAVFPFGEWGAVSYARDAKEFARHYRELSLHPQEALKNQAAGREKILNDFVGMPQAISGEAFLSAMKELR